MNHFLNFSTIFFTAILTLPISSSVIDEKNGKERVLSDINSEFGFWYTYNIKDSLGSKLPVKGDEIVFSYEIRNFKDEIIYSDDEIGEKNYLVDQEELITVLQEGGKLMKEGEIISFLFPSHKAFGYTGNDKIQSNEPLIYKVHLKEMMKKN